MKSTEKIKALWLCNYILPQISQWEKSSTTPYGGWVSSLLEKLMDDERIELIIIFPQPTQTAIAGKYGSVRYESVLFNPCADFVSDSTVTSFKKVLNKEQPDVIHIFGTEFCSALEMATAAEQLSLIERVIVNIQGLAHVSRRLMYMSLPESVQNSASLVERIRHITLRESKKNLIARGDMEIEALKKIRHVFGRTMWDKACVYNINSNIEYHYCPEILRKPFYTGEWEYKNCVKQTVFSVAEHPIKGLPYLLQAMSIVVEKYPNAKLRIVGSHRTRSEFGFLHFLYIPVYDKYISKLIKKLKLENNVEFLGCLNVDEMKQEYLNANVFVLSSVMENESNTLSEAKLLGLPCVASYVGGTTNRIEHGVDGYQYPCLEPEILAYYLCEVFEKPNLATELGRNARMKAQRINNPKDNKDNVLSVYFRIAERE